jgi:hypothetical protein
MIKWRKDLHAERRAIAPGEWVVCYKKHYPWRDFANKNTPTSGTTLRLDYIYSATETVLSPRRLT